MRSRLYVKQGRDSIKVPQTCYSRIYTIVNTPGVAQRAAAARLEADQSSQEQSQPHGVAARKRPHKSSCITFHDPNDDPVQRRFGDVAREEAPK